MSSTGGSALLTPSRLGRALGLGPGQDLDPRWVKTKQMATLWAGYGSVTEVTVALPTAANRAGGTGGTHDDGEPGTMTTTRRLILKRVSPPPNGRGVSHDRKLRSYEAEAAFYSCAPDGPAWALLDAGLAVPTPLATASDKTSCLREFLLSDLRVTHPRRFRGGSFDEAVAGLTFLAGMHAAFWERPTPAGVWPEGSYWRLDTRLDELSRTDDVRVVRSARAIDLRLRGVVSDADGERKQRRARRTLIHGDPKGDNLLLSEAGARGETTTAAAYDFQYVGGGLGARDVAYFLTAAVDPRVLEAHEDALVAAYHAALLEGLEGREGRPEDAESVDACRASYPLDALRDDLELAVADYARFMAGWGYWGNAEWAEATASRCLDRIDAGKTLDSEEAYVHAVARAYPFPEY